MSLEWLIFALLGTVFFSGAGVLDKLLLSNSTDSKAYIVCQVLAQQLFTIPLFLIEAPNFVYPESLIALLFGCLQIFPSFFYMQALQNEEASKVSAMEYVYLIFVFVGSIFLFGEVLDPKCCAGGLLLIIGILILSYKKNGAIGKGSNSSRPKILANLMALMPSIKPFLSYWILTAIYYLCLKFLLLSMNEWHLYIWSSLGSLMVVLPLMSKQSIRSEVTGFFAKGGIAVGALISEETLQFLGLIFSIFAYAIGSVTLVSSVGALQPIMTVLLILGLGVLAPKLAKEMDERTDRRSLLQKGISFMVVLIGIYFVS